MSRLPALGPRGEGWVVIQFLLLGLVAFAGVRFGGVANGLPTPAIAWAGMALVLVTVFSRRSARRWSPAVAVPDTVRS